MLQSKKKGNSIGPATSLPWPKQAVAGSPTGKHHHPRPPDSPGVTDAGLRMTTLLLLFSLSLERKP